MSLEECAQNRRVILWYPFVCLNHKSDSGRKYGDKCTTHWGWWAAQLKVKERWRKRIGGFIERDYLIGLCVLWFPSENIDSARKWKVGIESHSQVLEGHDASRKNSGKEGSIAGNHSPKSEPQERNPWTPKFDERAQDETLKQERCARRDAWERAKDVHKLKKESKDTFYSPAEAWVMPWQTCKEPHLTKNGIQTPCRTENFFPLVVPGLSSSSTQLHPDIASERSIYFLGSSKNAK